MADAAEALRDAIGHLAKSVESVDRDAIVLDVEVLLDMAIPLIAVGETGPMDDVLPLLQKLYGVTLTGDGPVDRDDATVGRLETLTVLFTLASLRPTRSDLEKIAAEPVVAALLRVLSASDEALSNQALAQAAGYGEETVARAMPRLRGLGLVSTYQEWRTKMNRITDAGRSMVVPAAA